MAVSLRPHAAALTVLLFLVAVPASAAETWTCWSGLGENDDGVVVQVTRCRLAGRVETADYGSAGAVPAVLRPQVGSGDGGLCWYWTTRSSEWVVLGIDDDLVATLGIDPDGIPGGPVIVDAAYPACTSEPADAPSALAEAYELLAQYEHPRPLATVDPPPGSGVAGMTLFLADRPPPAWSAALVSPLSGRRIEVETFVDAVEVDWGDGNETTVPAVAFALLTGWPDGAFGHVYETKTCTVPGGPRCHPTLSAYQLTVSYRWLARFRVDGGPWLPIPVPPTAVSVAYDVDEILALTTAVG